MSIRAQRKPQAQEGQNRTQLRREKGDCPRKLQLFSVPTVWVPARMHLGEETRMCDS